ncbi:MAG: NADP-reducing hydrogenase subunit HndC [bacterium ADurb.Bin429]|nr:MAG: NADP-reducing hydrogenase subunit HndC [bacterium ADurb.Bin429]
MITSPEQLAEYRAKCRSAQTLLRPRLLVGMATCGLASGAAKVFAALREEAALRGVDIDIVATGCKGACFLEPLIDAVIPGKARVTYAGVTVEDVPDLLDAVLAGAVYAKRALARETAECLLIEDCAEPYPADANLEGVPAYDAVPFFHGQLHLAMRNCGYLDPTSIDEYIARGGYAAAARALTTMTPEQIIEAIKTSGLRGRGGGGFPTGRKWESCRKAHGTPKYVVCNADEGDPGAYMDRSILESDPHSVLEGMIIGSFAVGANQGFIYVREEYPLAVERLRHAITQAEELGLLGTNIFDTGHDFTLRINRGAGAFVCGESTALMASLEGRVGEPRAKYIHTVESGLWGKPSCLNNVETWNNVPVVIQRGAEWFAGIGTEGSKGTKVFSLVGKVRHVGLVEVPMGMTLRAVIEGIGGGVPEGRQLKAIQTGGPSGGCIPAEYLDSPVDFESLSSLGSMMGSGGVIVMDDRTCMVDVARYFLAFLKDESCGKCVPCREGTGRMLDILTAICEGRGEPGDIEILRDLATVMSEASLCGLGTSAANPVLTTLQYFADEYQAHIADHTCPAKVCRALLRYSILTEACTGCAACAKVCPVNAISGERKSPHVIDETACIKCGQCYEICRFSAIEVA